MSHGFLRRSRRRLLLSLVAGAMLSLVSCWTPVYDPAVSLSARLESKLEAVDGFGPIEIPDDDDYAHYFVPEKILYPASGYWTRLRGGDSQAYIFYLSNMSTFLPPATYNCPKETIAICYPVAAPNQTLASIGAMTILRDKVLTQLLSASGDVLASIPTGALLLLYEAEDLSAVPTIWYTYFTRSTVIRRKDAYDQLYIDIFRYPTAKLAELAK